MCDKDRRLDQVCMIHLILSCLLFQPTFSFFPWLYDSLFNLKFYTACCWLGTNFWICWFKYIWMIKGLSWKWLLGWDGMRVSGPGHLGPTLRAWNSRGSCSRSLEMDHEWILLVTKNVIDGHWELLDLESNLLKLRRRSQQIASWIKLYVVLNQKSYWLSSGYRTAGQDLMIWSKLLGFGTKGNRKQTRK